MHTHTGCGLTLIKLLYFPLQYPKIDPYIHQGERLWARLLFSAPQASEKNAYRKLGGPLDHTEMLLRAETGLVHAVCYLPIRTEHRSSQLIDRLAD
jgi:hypothetical protein